MSRSIIPEGQGRSLFGGNPEGYESVRPDYPDALYELILKHCPPVDSAPVLEIGAGSGIATRALLSLGYAPLVALEPDQRFRPQLESLAAEHTPRLTVSYCPFEQVTLTPGSIGLAVCATAFHWLDPSQRATRLANCLRADGGVALMWNLFQDLHRTDEFHEATAELLADLEDSPSRNALPFALRRDELEAEFNGAGFEALGYVEDRWRLRLDTTEVGLLYETFSPIQRLVVGERDELLERLKAVAADQFGGHVERNMTSVCYLFRKRTG